MMPAPTDLFRGPLPEDTRRTSILIAMLTIAIYMSALVDLKAIITFKRHNTLYFWSLLVTSWGIIGHSLGVILKWFVGSCPWEVHTAFASFGWWGMVTGQSLVLYSRLHLVVRNQRVLRAVLVMIIFDFCLFQVPTTVQKFGSTRTEAGVWLTVYHVYERIQLIVFTLQELIISIIYIRAAMTWLSPGDPEGQRHTKQFLIYLNVLCIALDIAIDCEVFAGEWIYEEATQSLAYAIKLTLEFAVLNQVMEVYRLGPGGCTTCRRKFTSRSLNDGSKRGNGRVACLGLAWPRSTPKVSERSGSFDEALVMDHGLVVDVVTGDLERFHPTSEKLQQNHVGKNIIITTGISTYIEDGLIKDNNRIGG